MRARRLILTGLLLAAAALGVGLSDRPNPVDPRAPVAVVSAPVDPWVEGEISRAQAEGVRPGNEPRLVRHAPDRSPVAFLYVHGFGASRAEGEAVLDPLAAEMGANTLYMLLPGHGTDDPDHHASGTAAAYLSATAQAFEEARQLGERLVIVGSSTGGLLATWLAAEHPDEVAALILASPFYAFARPEAVLLDKRLGALLVPMVQGPDRYAGWKVNPEGRVQQPGYDQHWTTHQRTSIMFQLADLRRALATRETFEKVKAPTLLMYYDKDPEHTDGVVDVGAIRTAFGQLGGPGGGDARSRLVNIEDGNHILMSAHVRTDKERINKEIRSFLAAVLPPAAQP